MEKRGVRKGGRVMKKRGGDGADDTWSFHPC